MEYYWRCRDEVQYDTIHVPLHHKQHNFLGNIDNGLHETVEGSVPLMQPQIQWASFLEPLLQSWALRGKQSAVCFLRLEVWAQTSCAHCPAPNLYWQIWWVDPLLDTPVMICSFTSMQFRDCKREQRCSKGDHCRVTAIFSNRCQICSWKWLDEGSRSSWWSSDYIKACSFLNVYRCREPTYLKFQVSLKASPKYS